MVLNTAMSYHALVPLEILHTTGIIVLNTTMSYHAFVPLEIFWLRYVLAILAWIIGKPMGNKFSRASHLIIIILIIIVYSTKLIYMGLILYSTCPY